MVKINPKNSQIPQLSQCKLPLFKQLKYTTEPINYLGNLISQKGIEVNAMETNLLSKIRSKINLWKMLNPSLKGKVVLLNTFILSEIGIAPNFSLYPLIS